MDKKDDILCGECQKKLLEGKYNDIPPLVCGHHFTLHQNKISALQALVGRKNEALQKIVNCHEENECGFCGSLRIAQEALKEK